MSSFRRELGEEISALNKKLDTIKTRLDNNEAELNTIKTRLDTNETRIDIIDKTLNTHNELLNLLNYAIRSTLDANSNPTRRRRWRRCARSNRNCHRWYSGEGRRKS